MMRPLSLLVCFSIAIAGAVGLSGQNAGQAPGPTAMQSVEAAFPKELQYPGEPPSGDGAPYHPYRTCAAVYSRKSDGGPDLIAASYSADSTGIAMLRYDSARAQILDLVTSRRFFFGDGALCSVSIVDLADSAHSSGLLEKTIKFSFEGQDWFFVWNGAKLQNITALTRPDSAWRSNHVPDSKMAETYLADLDHRGPMQIVGNNEDGDKFPKTDGIAASPSLSLFRYNGKTYKSSETLLSLGRFEPEPPNGSGSATDSWADENKSSIDMHHAPKPSYQLKIVNGDRDGSNRVTSAKVEINGVTVVSPTQVNQGVETLTETIQLQKQNTIKVTVDGPAKSHIYVVVE